MPVPVVVDAFFRLSEKPNIFEFSKTREDAAEHIGRVIGLAEVYYVGDRQRTRPTDLSGVLDTLTVDTPAEGLVEAIDYADRNLDPEGKSKVYKSVVKCLAESFETTPNHRITDENRNAKKVDKNISRIEAILALLTTEIDGDPVVDAHDASIILAKVVEDIRYGKAELYDKDKKNRDKDSVIDRIQWTRLSIFELYGHKSEVQNQLFIDALDIYADEKLSTSLRERALSYAIEHCPLMKDVPPENIDESTRYPTSYALKLLSATDDPDVIATALEIAIEDFSPFLSKHDQLQADIENKQTERWKVFGGKDPATTDFGGINSEGQRGEMHRKVKEYDIDIEEMRRSDTTYLSHIIDGVLQVQNAIIGKIIPILSTEQGRSLFGLVYYSMEEMPAWSSSIRTDDFRKKCVSKLEKAYEAYASPNQPKYNDFKLREAFIFMNSLKQPVVADK